MVETSVKLRISVWRDFNPKRTVVGQDSSNQGQGLMIPDNLQEEVYSWQTLEDPFGGVADVTVRNQLRSHLFDRLAPSQPPAERRLTVLDEFITSAEKALAAGHAEWTTSQASATEDDELADKVDSLLALTLHLRWLSRCFADRPGISVSVR